MGLSQQITPVLSNGLEALRPEAVDDVSLAGMGGDLIAEIIGRAGWLRDESKHLVLQPMSHVEALRRWLLEQGFVIREEHGVRDAGRLYCLLSVSYGGRPRNPTRLECLTGMLAQSGRSASRDYLLHQPAACEASRGKWLILILLVIFLKKITN